MRPCTTSPAAVPGGRLGDISAAIGTVGHAARYGIPADFGGHGIGHTMHEDPHIPNAGRPGRGLRLVPGLVVAITDDGPVVLTAPA